MNHRPKILLIGESGQIGWELTAHLGVVARVISVDFPEIDLTRSDSFVPLIREIRPDVIINAAAYTAVDAAESEPDRCKAINAVAPCVLAKEAERIDALMVHFSTDYVFDGTSRVPYVESDPPNPINEYGRSKLAGDRAVTAAGGRHQIFRLCWVYGNRGRNFYLTIRKLASEREDLRIVCDQFGCPSWSRMLAESASEAILVALDLPRDESLLGTFHLAASGTASWYEFAGAIVSSIPENERLCRRIEPIATDEYPLPAARPMFSALSTARFESSFGIRLPHWRESFEEMVARASSRAPALL